MIRRRVLIVLAGLTTGTLGSRLAHAADSAQKVVRVGFVDPGPSSGPPPYQTVFWERLRELGWVKDHNLIVERRSADGRLDRLSTLMAEMVGRQVDVLVTYGTPGAIAAKNATKTIPIVDAEMGDPIGTGIVVSLARPGVNLTGLSLGWTEDIAGKWLELLQEMVPRLSTVAVIANPDHQMNRDQAKRLKAIAPKRNIKIQLFDVRGPDDLDRAFDQAGRNAQAVLVLPDPGISRDERHVAALAASHRLPDMHVLREFVDAGGLMAYAPDFLSMFRRAADYVDKILKGAKPGDLPIEQPTQYLLVINLKTAKALGLTIPESILLRADEVIR
jgi:putative ABC transport system substrate-binding protein